MKLLFILLLITFSLTTLKANYQPWQRDLNSLKSCYVKKLKKEERLRLSGIGGGGGRKNFKFVNFIFDYDDKSSIDEARVKFVNNVELLLTILNKNEKLIPYMSNYPFDIKNINFSILYISKKMEWYTTPYVSSVGNNGNEILYMQINNEPNASPLFNIIHTETYEEAKNIVLSSSKINSP